MTSTWVCSIRILSSVGGYYPAPLVLLLVFAARRKLLPSGQLWFVPSRFQPCLTNLPTVKRPLHVGWFCSRVSVLNNIFYRQGVIWFHVNVLWLKTTTFIMRELFRRGSRIAPRVVFVSRPAVPTLHNPTITWTCVHSQKVVSGIRLCNCFLATLFAGKCLQIWQWTNCRILQLQNKK